MYAAYLALLTNSLLLIILTVPRHTLSSYQIDHVLQKRKEEDLQINFFVF